MEAAVPANLKNQRFSLQTVFSNALKGKKVRKFLDKTRKIEKNKNECKEGEFQYQI